VKFGFENYLGPATAPEIDTDKAKLAAADKPERKLSAEQIKAAWSRVLDRINAALD
jgi:hypothetical protein